MTEDGVERTLRIIKDYLLRQYDIKLMYLYGSFATPNFSDNSDIDVAVYAEEFGFEERMEVSAELEGLTGKKIDLVNLKEIDINFVAEIVISGENIYNETDEFQEDYELRVLSQYLTFEEDRRVVIEEIYKRGSIYGKGSFK